MRSLGLLAVALCTVAGSAQSDPASTKALNTFRADAGRAPLAYSSDLESAADRHARDMAHKQFFSHTGSDGTDVALRVTQAGYGWCFVAENIAQGQRDLVEVMEAWATSPGHRRNMLSRDATEYALVQAPGRIWVMVLASPGC